ncbi:uncharacterized protein LOC115743289 isoform X2 [Rhodamnia argentea]|uniref:Uncharacterized protein LOC115743289 isoform X2 n=1 Tax=Rhodamnia argentea TaxID=178133 RepID=A0ABM3GXJ3_9MYRT|nr:uncharacterized protein LOC115743289 isoform X2 [Rhodamnia argentea]
MMSEAREDPSQKFRIDRADRNFGDVCSQTGEEFSVEFLRDRMGVRRIQAMPNADHFLPQSPSFNFIKDQHVVYEDASGPLRHVRGNSYGNADFSNVVAKPMPSPYMESPTHLDYGARPPGEYDFFGQRSNIYYDEAAHTRGAMDPLYSSGSPQSYYHHGLGIIAPGSSHCKMKFLCSYGGRIFPRPSDGKLRYVGGETRIISIRRNLSWEELVKKTLAICNQPHTIKYQLPGEDLDALISVCSDEDLHHMIEEYQELEKVGTCQRLRLFLVPLTEIESPNSFEARLAAEQQDVDYQYVVAVNGILDRSPQKSAKVQTPSSQVMHQGTTSSDNSPSCHKDSPTFAQALDINDYSPSYSNLARTSSNPSAQLVTTRPIPNSLLDHSPPMTPVPLQQRDFTNHSHVNEGNMHFVLDKYPSDKSYCYDNSNHQNPTSTQPLQLIDSQMANLFEAEQTYRQRGFHVHDQNMTEDCVPGSCYGLFDINFGRPIVKERLFHSDKLATRPEGPACQLLGSLELDGPHYGLMHTLSDSQLQGLNRGSMHSTEDGTISCSLNCSTEKVPLLATSTHSSQEWKMKSQDPTAAKYQESTSGLRSNEEVRVIRDESILEWQDNKDFNSLQEKKQFRVIVDEDCANMLQEHKASSNVEVNVSSESQKYTIAPLEDAKRMVCIKSAVKDQRGHNPAWTQGSLKQVPELARPSVSPSTSCKERESHEEGSVDRAGEVRYEGGSNKGLKPVNVLPPCEENHRNVVQPIPVIVEDVTDNTSLDIPISSRIVAHIQDDPSDSISSARETEGESIAADTDYEDVKSDGHDADDPISDAAIAEIEAGIYGLQIIKNADLEELQELGSGTFGTVYHGKWRGTDVAIKRIKKSCFAGRSSEQERITKDFWREAKILSNLHHPNVVAFYGVVPDGPGGTLATVAEFMVNGSLRHNLVRNSRALDRRKKLMIAMDAAFGMEYLHFKNIVHFDLKCDNLLVNLKDPRRPICKVADFGLSRIKQNTFVSGGIRGTLPWMAPELLNGTNNRVSEKVDIFSFGIAMWEMLTGEEPYANMHCGAIIGGIVSNTLRPPIPERCDPEWRELMEECWSADPSNRPTFTQITMRLQTMLKTLQTKRYPDKPKY